MGVYEPSEDSFLLADNLDIPKGAIVLDVGTGTGILAIRAYELEGRVIAIDISIKAVKTAKANFEKIGADIALICGDFRSCIAQKRLFDCIVCNPPYLPEDKDRDVRWTGGKEGWEFIADLIRFARSRLKKGGKLLFVCSSLSKPEIIFFKLKEAGFSYKVKAKKRYFFEELMVVEAKLDNYSGGAKL